MAERTHGHGGGSRRRASPRARREGGHLAALEAAFVGMLLMSSVAFVISLPQPKPAGAGVREPLQEVVADLLVALEEVQGSDRYANALERAIAQAMHGNTTAFDRVVERSLAPGAECRLWVDNGRQARLVAGPSERLARESVSTSVLWRPQWAYALGVPALDIVGESQPLPVQGYLVSQGSLVKEAGVPLQLTLETSTGTYDRAATTSVAAGAPGVSLYLRNETAQPGFVYDETALPTSTDQTLKAVGVDGPPPASNFTVPALQETLKVTVIMKGTAVAYTLTFTDPAGAPWPLAVTNAVPAVLTVPAPLAGLWTYSGAGTHVGDALNPARTDLWANATATSAANAWTLVVEEQGGGKVARGTGLNITLPGAFSGVDQTSTSQAGWRAIRAGEDLESGAWVYAELDQDLSNGQAALTFTGMRPTNADGIYAIHAALNGSSYARATFLLAGATGVTSPQNELDAEPYLSVPKPLRPGGTSTWGVAFPYPSLAAVGTQTLWNLDVKAADGTALFTGVQGLSPAHGTWSLVSPGHLRWNGTWTLPANEAAQFAFKVNATSNVTPHEPSIAPPLLFPTGGGSGTAAFRLAQQERPHVAVVTVPPPYDGAGRPQAGYRTTSESTAVQAGNATANLTDIQRGLRATGEVAYATTEWGTVSSLAAATRAGLARSHLALDTTSVRVGERFNVTVDFQGLFDDLAPYQGVNVTGWNVELLVFDPTQPFQPFATMKPSFKARFGATADPALDVQAPTDVAAVPRWSVASSADGIPQATVTSRAKAEVQLEPPAAAFHGPHAVVARANFVLNDALGTSMVQSARLLGVIDVLPDGGQSGTALYHVTLECWLPDW